MDKRVCSRCKCEKQLEEFTRNKRCKGEREGVCKQCINDRNRVIPISPSGMQYCRICNTHKKLDNFEKCSDCSSGYRYRCKDCRNEIYKQKKEGIYIKPKKKLSRKENAKITEKEREIFVGKEGAKWGEFRGTLKYKEWRRKVFERDGFKCTECGCEEIEKLHAHHIKPWKEYIELRFDIDNGQTLCQSCHMREEGYRRPNMVIPDDRECKVCRITKPIDEFGKEIMSGKIYHRHLCKECRKEKRRGT